MKLKLLLVVLAVAGLSGCVTRQISPPTLTPSASWWYEKDGTTEEK